MEAVHALALDQRAEMADAIADMLIQHADAKQDAQDDLANSRTTLAASNTAILAEEWLALAADIAFANADFDQVRQQLQASFSNIDEAAAADSAALQRQIDQIAGQRAAAFAAAQQTRTSSVQELIVADATTTVALAAARKASQEEIASRDEMWETAKRMPPPPPPPPPRIFANPPASIGRVLGEVRRDSAAERANLQHHDNTEQRIAIGQDALEMFLDFTLFGTVKNLYGAITGHDFIRDREMTSVERAWCGFFGGLAVAGPLIGMFDDIAETVSHYAKRLKGVTEPLDDAAAPAIQSTKRIVDSSTSLADDAKYGVRFFGDEQIRFYSGDGARLGRADQVVFFSPVEDMAVVRNAADAMRHSGMAPSVTRAYIEGGEVFGISFPLTGLEVRLPTASDAGGWPHFLEGGRTAVRLSSNGGYLVNSTREFVTNGVAVPKGAVLFRLGSNGEWTILRRF